jgi:Fe-S-cluster containining protein
MTPPPDDSDSRNDQPEWYAEGLRFTCTQCGNCCTGPTGFVWVTDEEIADLATALSISDEDFRSQYTRTVHGRISLNERPSQFGLDCVFLDRSRTDGRAICRVYADRPLQCRTFPFWHENLTSPRDWQRTGRTCPGLNTGRLVPIEEIRIRRDAQPGTDGL